MAGARVTTPPAPPWQGGERLCRALRLFPGANGGPGTRHHPPTPPSQAVERYKAPSETRTTNNATGEWKLTHVGWAPPTGNGPVRWAVPTLRPAMVTSASRLTRSPLSGLYGARESWNRSSVAKDWQIALLWRQSALADTLETSGDVFPRRGWCPAGRQAMSTQPAPMQRESVCDHDRTFAIAGDRANAGLAPARAAGSLRCDCTHIWAFLWRRSQLAALPDVGEPFDVAAFRSPARVPDDRNAFVPYHRAAQRFRDMNRGGGLFVLEREPGVVEGRRHLSRLGRRSTMRRSPCCAPARHCPEFFVDLPTQAVQPPTIDSNVLAVRLSWIGTAGLFKAGRLRAEGDPAGAWTLLKAVIRASRHLVWTVRQPRIVPSGSAWSSMLASRSPTGPKTRPLESRSCVMLSTTWPPPKPSHLHSLHSIVRNISAPRSR